MSPKAYVEGLVPRVSLLKMVEPKERYLGMEEAVLRESYRLLPPLLPFL